MIFTLSDGSRGATKTCGMRTEGRTPGAYAPDMSEKDLKKRLLQTLIASQDRELELEGLTTTVTNPQIYALGTVTTGVSFVVIFAALGLIQALRR